MTTRAIGSHPGRATEGEGPQGDGENGALTLSTRRAPAGRLERLLDATVFPVAGLVVGRRYTAAIREMERVQWLPEDQLWRRAEARLSPLLEHAARHVPFYRELYRQGGLAPDALGTVADLQRLPIVSKPTYREHPLDDFLAANLPPHRRVADSTSGSSGQPFRFYRDRQAIPLVFANALFAHAWWDLRPFDRSLRLRGRQPPAAPLPADAPPAARLRQRVKDWLWGLYEARTQEVIPVWDVDRETAEAIYRRIEAFRPAYVLGYTATLANLADHLLRRNLRLQHRLRAVMTGAETLTPPRRRLIEQYFNAPIINPYGLREIGACIAQNCPASPEQFHVNTELVIWETVRADGTPAAPGEIGRVVITHLHNYVMPFIRYDTGDLAVAGGKPCSCGRGFPLVGPIDGRRIECVRTPSGKVISPAGLGQYLIVVPGHAEAVWHYQLVQETPERVRLLVVPAPELGREQRERLRDDLGRSLTQFLGDEMTVAVEMVTDIPAEESGKRLVIKAIQ